MNNKLNMHTLRDRDTQTHMQRALFGLETDAAAYTGECEWVPAIFT